MAFPNTRRTGPRASHYSQGVGITAGAPSCTDLVSELLWQRLAALAAV
jgi:hypothetical protein